MDSYNKINNLTEDTHEYVGAKISIHGPSHPFPPKPCS